MILKFFDIFLKMKDLSNSEAFMVSIVKGHEISLLKIKCFFYEIFVEPKLAIRYVVTDTWVNFTNSFL